MDRALSRSIAKLRRAMEMIDEAGEKCGHGDVKEKCGFIANDIHDLVTSVEESKADE